MKTPRRIRTVIVSLPAEYGEDLGTWDHATTGLTAPARQTRSRLRPSDLLPWSDPYIASLVTQLQADVRRSQAIADSRLAAEAEMPWNEPFEYDSEDDYEFSIDPDQLMSK